MGSLRGFLDFSRKDFDYLDIHNRLKNFDEFLIMQNDREIKKQAARCMECEIPYCHALGCPLLNRIPEWLDAVFHNDIEKAYHSLIQTNSFPEFTGRICPALCESSCSLSINLAPVTIKQIELYIIEKAFRYQLVKPDPPDNCYKERVAIIGSGPSGLSAAHMLNTKGYNVTVYEKSDEIGGLMRYGIPNFKLPKWVIDRRVDLMKKAGIVFHTNAIIDEKQGLDYLRNEYDAVLLCTGTQTPRDLQVPGRHLKGIHFAIPYLTQATRWVEGKMEQGEIINAKDKKVLIVGGGDTGSDCIGTANRQGAKMVTQIEILPMPMMWTKSYNPSWPLYPRIVRTSSSHQEGCIRDFSINTKEFISYDGEQVAGAKCVRVDWQEDNNKRKIMKEVPESEFFIEADLIILSMGFLSDEIKVLPEGVFVAGDKATGASLVCKAIQQGRQAAASIDEYFIKKRKGER